jgi:hypothetical protein
MHSHRDVTRDIFDLLIRSHRDLQALVWDLAWVTERGDADTAASLVRELAAAAVSHAHAEEVLCRRLADAAPELTFAVERARASRATIAAWITELHRAADDQTPVIVALDRQLQRHVDAQERELFPKAVAELDLYEPLWLGALAAAATCAASTVELADDDPAILEVIEVADATSAAAR